MRSSRQDIQNIYPLSPMQQAMFFYIQLAPDSGLCFQQFGYTLHGALDAAALRRSWDTLVARHDVLRTEFRWGKTEQPLQVVRRRIELPWHEEDLRGTGPDEQARRIAEYAARDRADDFDLRRAPLLRVALFRTGDREWRLLWSCSHLLLDGWSGSLLLAEMMEIYRAVAAGSEPSLPAPRPFSDYIAWLQKTPAAESESYWRRTLSGLDEPTPLGVQRRGRRAGDEEAGYAELEVELGRDLTARLGEVARSVGVTLATLLQAAWALVLSRSSGRDDVVFGIAVSGRPEELAGAESMLGLFINTLPLRLRVPADATVGEWLRDVARAQLEARAYEHVPLPRIHRWSGLGGGVPLFESAVAFESYPQPPSPSSEEEAALTIDETTLLHDGLIDPVTLLFSPGDELRGKLQYQSARFDETAMQSVVDQLRDVLAQIAASPDRPVREVRLLGQDASRELTERWNATEGDYPPSTLHELVATQVGRTPERTAVTFEGRSLTYRELSRRAGGLAAYLGRLGVGPGDYVGLCMEPGLELIVGVLGILETGAAYVPLDPDYPQARLAFMVADSGAKWIVADAACAPIASACGAAVVDVDRQWSEIAGAPPPSDRPAISPDAAVYVVYTSGSTGQPKGVCVSHRGLVNHMTWMIREFGWSASDTIVHTSSFNFDASAWQMFAPLLTGGRLVFVSRATVKDPRALASAIRDEATTMLLAVPSLLEMLTQTEGEPYDGLRFLFTGGEATSASLCRDARARFPAPFVNLYGPTEATIDATSYRVEGEVTTATVPIGLPIQNTKAYVLSDRLEPVPPGVPGQLFLAGVGLAWGYHQRPALTASRFVPDPHDRGGRLYRTGDLVRRLPDGNLEFLGRADHQVKLRGFRIELGEIEAALLRAPGVSRALATVREDRPGDRRLVAYFTGSAEPSALRSALERDLPDYMVPSAWVRLDAFPLTPAGKIDVKAVPIPETPRATHAAIGLATPAERQMAELFREILGVDRVEPEDDFFSLGGHSQLAVKLAARVEQVFGANLPLIALLEDATVGGLVRRLEGLDVRTPEGALVELRHGQPTHTLFLLHASGGTIMPYVPLVRHLGKPWQVYGLQHPGIGADAKSYADLREQMSDYAAAVRAVQPHGPYRLAGWSVGGLLAYELAGLLRAEGEEVECVVMIDASVPPREAQDLVREVGFVAAVWMYEVAAMAGCEVDVDAVALRAMSPERCVDHAIERLRACGAIPADAPDGPWRTRFDAYLGNVRRAAQSELRPGAARTVLLRATERLMDRPYGWTELGVDVETIEVPGNHFSALAPPHVEELAARLRDALVGSG